MKLVYESTKVPGLYYVPNYLSTLELMKVSQFTRFLDNLGSPFGKSSRRVAQFGYAYSYSYFSPGLKKLDRAVPKWLLKIVSPSRIDSTLGRPVLLPPPYETEAKKTTTEFDALTVNEYKRTQGICAHVDNKEQFGPVIVCLTIGAPGKIVFARRGHGTEAIEVQPGSLYVMSGPARYNWTHEVVPNDARKPRYSLTFRQSRVGNKGLN